MDRIRARRKPITEATGTASPASPIAGSGTASDDYYRRIEDYARRIRASDDLSEIVRLLDEALRETHGLRASAELAYARERVARAERQIAALKSEIETINGLLRVDPLTGALNRRGLEEDYAREAARSERHGSALSLALLDLDDFKQINDRLGHEAGDRTLVHFVRAARTALRPQDTLARVGGEEFAILLPQTAQESALAAVRRLQGSIADTPLVLGPAKLALSFSAGVAERQSGESLEALLRRADVALYRAKREGKRRVLPAV